MIDEFPFGPVSAARARGIVTGRAKVSEDVHGLGWAEENGLLGSTDARGQAIRSGNSFSKFSIRKRSVKSGLCGWKYAPCFTS